MSIFIFKVLVKKDIPFFTNTLKMKMDMIYPADNPTVAVFSGHGIRVRIDKDADIPPGKLEYSVKTLKGFVKEKSILKHLMIQLLSLMN